MVKRTGPTNYHVRLLINDLRKRESGFWKRIAQELAKPRRNRRVVNLSRINRFTKPGDKVIVPGKVLGTGSLNHKLTIIALSASDKAKQKIAESKSELLMIKDYAGANKSIDGVRIIG